MGCDSYNWVVDSDSEKVTSVRKICGHKQGSALPYSNHQSVIIFLRIIPNLVKNETGFPSEKDVFSVGSADGDNSLWPNAPMPGQESIRLAKKGNDSLLEVRASAVSARLSLCLGVSLRNQRGESRKGFSRPFLSSAPVFFPGQQGNGSERPIKLQMILFSLGKVFIY